MGCRGRELRCRRVRGWWPERGDAPRAGSLRCEGHLAMAMLAAALVLASGCSDSSDEPGAFVRGGAVGCTTAGTSRTEPASTARWTSRAGSLSGSPRKREPDPGVLAGGTGDAGRGGAHGPDPPVPGVRRPGSGLSDPAELPGSSSRCHLVEIVQLTEAGSGDHIRGSVTPTWFWYFPFRSAYVTSGSSSPGRRGAGRSPRRRRSSRAGGGVGDLEGEIPPPRSRLQRRHVHDDPAAGIGALPTQRTSTSRGTRKYSTVRARANEFGGMMQVSAFTSTKERSSKSFGSTTTLWTLVKTLNSGATRMSYPKDETP
jgi:hypothetical protein